jgi:transposase-like protein
VPKGALRYVSIGIALALGCDPRWWPKGRTPWSRQVLAYGRYSNRETFYRSPRAILAALDAHGWDARFSAVEPDRPRWLVRWPRLLAWWHRHLAANVVLLGRAR